MESINAGVNAVVIVIEIAVAVFFLICQWILFTKAGKPGWAVIIPFYNLYVLFDIIYGKGVKFLLLLIPLFNIVVCIAVAIRTAHVYGKGTGFGILNLFLPIIAQPILAFGSAEYKGPVDSFL